MIPFISLSQLEKSSIEGTLNVCIPYSKIESILKQHHRWSWRKRMQTAAWIDSWVVLELKSIRLALKILWKLLIQVNCFHSEWNQTWTWFISSRKSNWHQFITSPLQMDTLYTTGHIHGFPSSFNASSSSSTTSFYNPIGSTWGSQEGVVALGVVLGSSISLVGLAFAFITYR